jgi:hypothetical protein
MGGTLQAYRNDWKDFNFEGDEIGIVEWIDVVNYKIIGMGYVLFLHRLIVISVGS